MDTPVAAQKGGGKTYGQMKWDEDAMRSTTRTSLEEAEMAVFLCDPDWLSATAAAPAAACGDDWILCSSAGGLAMIRLGSGKDKGGPEGPAPRDKESAGKSPSDANNDDDALSIRDMVRIQREIGRLSDGVPDKGIPDKGKPPKDALAF